MKERVSVGQISKPHLVEKGVAISIPALPRPTLAELRKKYPWIREEKGIERDTSPIEASILQLGTVLENNKNEDYIDGVEYWRRLKSMRGLMGYQHALWLLEHQDEYPPDLFGENISIDFPGLIVVGSDDCRNFPFLVGARNGKRWFLSWSVMEAYEGLGRGGRIAFSGDVFGE